MAGGAEQDQPGVPGLVVGAGGTEPDRALGGLVDTGREIAVVTGLGRSPRAELSPAGTGAAAHFDRQPERAPGATATRGS